MAKQSRVKKSQWRTLQCVVRYRTPSALSERDLARHVQYLLDVADHHTFRDSKMWAAPFTHAVSRMDAARPRRLRAAIRALDAAVARLRKL